MARLRKCYKGRSITLFLYCQIYIFGGVSSTLASNSFPITVRLGFVAEYFHFNHLQSQFNSLLAEYNSRTDELPFVRIKLKGIAVHWNSRHESPHTRLNTLFRRLVLQNVSAVISLLPQKENELLAYFLSDLPIPVLGSGSKEEQWYSRQKETDMYLPLVPSEHLQATVIKDVILEFDQSRFVCITVESHKDDLLIVHLMKYVMKKDVKPNCVTITRYPPPIEQIFTALTAIKASGVRVVFVHGSAQDVSALVGIANKLSLQKLSDSFVWIFSDKAVAPDVTSIPEGSIGIAKTFDVENVKTPRSAIRGLYTTLLHDGVMVFGHALDSVMKKYHAELVSECVNGRFQETLQTFLNREIRNGKYNGKTGPISFSDTGERETYRFNILKVKRKKSGDKEWQKIGFATPHRTEQDGPMAFEMFVPHDLPQPRRLKIVTIEHTPFTMVREPQFSTKMGTLCNVQDSVPCVKYLNAESRSDYFNKTNVHKDFVMKCCHGVLIDVLLRVQEQTGFTYDLYIVRDGKFGAVDANTGLWSGMIGDVERGEADMALGTITITEERSRHVDFTAPYMHTALSFLVQRKRHRKLPFPDWIKDMRLMKPFSQNLWLMCVATFIVISITVWFTEKFKKACAGRRNIKSGEFLAFEFMAYVFGNIFHVPLTRVLARTHSVPVLMVVVCFGALVLTSSYTANLTASLVLVEDVTVVSGIEDDKLVNPPPGFTFGTIKHTSIVDHFKNSSNFRLRRIYENMWPNNVDTFSDGLARVKTGKLKAFIASSVTLSYHVAADKKCGFKLDGRFFDLGGLGFPLRKNSSWRVPISQALLQIESKDEISRLFEKWKIVACKNLDGTQAMTAFSMGLDEFSGFLFNTAMCCCGSFVILLLEIIVYRKITRKRQQFHVSTRPSTVLKTLTTHRISNARDVSSTNTSDVSYL